MFTKIDSSFENESEVGNIYDVLLSDVLIGCQIGIF